MNHWQAVEKQPASAGQGRPARKAIGKRLISGERTQALLASFD
jgi:hypothetical protein